jgi:hypothetical protein
VLSFSRLSVQLYVEVAGCVPCTCAAYEAKLHNIKLKTWAKHILGSFPLDIALPGTIVKVRLGWANLG